MQGVNKAIADPIDPVTPSDERPSVKALIDEHREKIDKIKAEVSEDPLYDASKHDDLWILRFFLSHKKTKQAIAAAKTTLLFRQKYDLDAKDIRKHAPHKVKENRCAEYWDVRFGGDAVICALPDKKRGTVNFIKFTQMNPEASKVLSQETWDFSHVYMSEWNHQWLDYVTRTTGRLTKETRFVDMTGASFTKHFDRASNKWDGRIMNEMEDVYPQLLETIYVCYPPTFVHAAWALVRPVMPKRILDKIDFITPDSNEKERDRLLKHITKESLPVHCGGDNTAPPKDW